MNFVPQERVQSQTHVHNLDVPASVFQDTVKATSLIPQEQVHSQTHEQNFDVRTSVFQDTVKATSLIPQEQLHSQIHEQNFDVRTSVPERIEEQIWDIDEPLLKMQRALRREDRRPKIVFCIGHGSLEGKVRVALLTEDTSIWEVGTWEWSGHCSLVGD